VLQDGLDWGKNMGFNLTPFPLPFIYLL
jgi:hypothetical protein